MATIPGKALTVDYGRAYKLDKLEYYPRDDAGNGTVTKMRVETSLDGVHWTSQEVDWARSADCKTVAFDGTVAARYVRMTPLASVGNFFSASEIAIYKTDGTDGFAVGSNLNKATISDGDYSNMKNYLGLENREPDTPTFGSQIATTSPTSTITAFTTSTITRSPWRVLTAALNKRASSQVRSR